ncbi:MAG: cytidine deaminase [Oscillospiraceae bacterium]|nr:cytidine deaminase [Oscillospiraceae bacterium]
MYKELMEAAKRARANAYCRYSHFAVGAALLTEDGAVFTGCNVENAAYGECICAERTAVVKAVSAGHRKITAIAICGAPEGEEPEQPCTPCGACRQVLAEFGGGEMQVILTDGVYTLGTLLPGRFSL